MGECHVLVGVPSMSDRFGPGEHGIETTVFELATPGFCDLHEPFQLWPYAYP